MVRTVKNTFYYEDFSLCTALGILKYVLASHKDCLVHAVVISNDWVLGFSAINIKNIKARNNEDILKSLTPLNPLPWETQRQKYHRIQPHFQFQECFLSSGVSDTLGFHWLTLLVFTLTWAADLRGRLPPLSVTARGTYWRTQIKKTT